MPYSLTPNMADAARVIAELNAAFGRPPTYRELAHELDVPHPSRAHFYCRGLVERGWLPDDGRGRPARLELLCDPPPIDVTPFELTEQCRDRLDTLELEQFV